MKMREELPFSDSDKPTFSPVGWFSHELFYWHDTGNATGFLTASPFLQPYAHIESPDSKRRIEGLLQVTGVMRLLKAAEFGPASDQELLMAHSQDYVNHIDRLSAQGGGEAGVYAPVGYHSACAARLAVGASIQAVKDALQGSVKRSYALVRPPGHHAEPAMAMGFCLFNNAAIAALYACKQGLSRVAIVDWDVHHGNGIQKIFYQDPSVFYVSVHQDGLFPPMSGSVYEQGEGRGKGYNLNIPIPAGSGHGAYVAVMDRVIQPALDVFEPELVIISAGQDAGAFDPMGRQMCTSETYRYMTKQLLKIAEKHSSGRLVAIHEGGYSPWHTPFLVQAIITELLGIAPLSDPFLPNLEFLPGQMLTLEQENKINEALSVLRRFTWFTPS